MLDAFGPAIAFGVPLAAGAVVWLFYRELLLTDRFWVVAAAVVIAAALMHEGHTRAAALVAGLGVVVWLWLERRSRDD